MQDNEVPALGSVVLSCAGRDAGKFFVVVGHEGEEYVLIADGALRHTDKPKKKKIKHVKQKGLVIPIVKEKLESNERLFDYEIKSQLQALGYNKKI